MSHDAIALVRPLALVGLLCVLLLLQPDFGSVVVLAAVTAGVLFLAGARLRHFLLIVFVAGVLLAVLSVLQPYRLQRMVTFLDPWADPFRSGYQLTQALMRLVEGLFGLASAPAFKVAISGSTTTSSSHMARLPLALAVFAAHHAGFADTRVARGPWAGALLPDTSLWNCVVVRLQCVINVGVNTGTLPTKGLTLPFISYGGNSLLVCCALIGLVLRVQLERGRPG
jgi:cell division protein FtsW